jgi:hypothetical protein
MDNNGLKAPHEQKVKYRSPYERWYGFIFHPLWLYAYIPIIIGIILALTLPLIKQYLNRK